MLKIFYGREDVLKEKFIYDNIQKPAIVLVPDQYTVEAEKQAMKYLKVKSLMDVEIMSISRLGERILEKEGGLKENFIDKYGRHILLSKIIRDEAKELQAFGRVTEKPNFILKVNNFISQMKQYGISAEDLRELQAEGSLKDKLSDIALIYEKYQEHVTGKYVDSEDKASLYTEKISDYEELSDKQVWIYGFDSFSPNTLDAISQIVLKAKETNSVITFDDDDYDKEIFKLTALVMDKLSELSSDVERVRIPDSYKKEYKNESIKHIEENLYAMTYKRKMGRADIEFIQSANPYNEAETAASKVLELVRSGKMRFRDIAIISNDSGKGTKILSRVFEEYQIPLFVDKKRDVSKSGIVVMLVSLLAAIEEGFRTMSILDYMKSGFLPLSQDEIEDLENYAYINRIKGSMWKKEFKYGEAQKAEKLRKIVITPLVTLEKLSKEAKTNAEFIEGFTRFLEEDMKLEEKIEELVKYQEENEKELAQETKQIYSSILLILDQIRILLGEEPFDIKEFKKLILAGVSVFEVGVIPPTADAVSLGTTQRSRRADAKALLVLSVNDGILPMDSSSDEIFTAEELSKMAEGGKEVGKLDSIKLAEEKLAIYRTFAKPTEYLMVANCTSDSEGNALRPSPIFTKLQKIFEEAPVLADVLNRAGDEAEIALIGGKVNTLRHLTTNLQEMALTEELSDVWKQTLLWYRDSEEAKLIKEGIGFTNEKEDIDKLRVKELFGIKEEPLLASPSRLEKYSRCPFAHLMSYGLRTDERRIKQLDPRNIGDVYHNTFMEVFRKLSEERLIHTISREEADKLVEKYALLELGKLSESDFAFGKREDYRSKRLISIAKEVCWVLIRQARQGLIEEIKLEEDFGPGEALKPIEVKLESGEKVLIKGRIDRVDILSGGKVKIIDYKSGKEELNIKEVEKGFRLQLMLYLKAAQGEGREPAGVFYFLIKEPMESLLSGKEYSEETIEDQCYKSFKMNGLMVEDEDTIDALDQGLEGWSKIIPMQVTKEGLKSNYALPLEEFKELQRIVDNKVEEICQGLISGQIQLRPMKVKKTSACDKCGYRSICRFDTVFEGCRYEVIE